MSSEAIVNVTIGETYALEFAAKLRQRLSDLGSYAATAESENTLDWMEGLIRQLNQPAELIDPTTIFILHKSNADGAMWITKSEIP